MNDKYSLFLQSLMADEQIGECPIMILGNKIDKQGAASEEELRHYFGLNGRTTGKVKPTSLWHQYNNIARHNVAFVRYIVYYNSTANWSNESIQLIKIIINN